MRRKKVEGGNRLVAYYRYSGGSGQTEQSIEGQRRDCENYAKLHGLTILHEYIDRHISGKTDDRVEVAAGQTQDHTQRAAQKGQRADHDESAEHEPQGGRGTGLGFPFLRGDGHQEAAEDQTDDLRTDILHLGCRMQTDSARDITFKAGDAEAHVGRVAERRQHECRDADDNAGQNDEQILFFHVLFPPI